MTILGYDLNHYRSNSHKEVSYANFHGCILGEYCSVHMLSESLDVAKHILRNRIKTSKSLFTDIFYC